MFTVVITEKGGDQKRVNFDKAEVTIGRVQGNDVILPKGNVSKRHSRILLKDGKFIIVDLKSTNGTYVNGRKITSPLVIKPSDKIYIGDFILHVEGAEAAAAAAAPKGPPPRRKSAAAPPPPPRQQPPPPEPAHDDVPPYMDEEEALPPEPVVAPKKARGRRRASGPSAAQAQPPPPEDLPEPAAPPAKRASRRPAAEAAPKPKVKAKAKAKAKAAAEPARARPSVAAGDPRRAKLIEVLATVHDRVIEAMDLRRLDIEKLNDEELWDRTEATIADIVSQMDQAGEIPAFVDQEPLIEDVLNEALGLGPLEEFLQDDTITEIMVNNAEQLYIERDGRLHLVDKTFSSDKAVMAVIERIVAPIGRRIDESSPLVDARLKDGSRVNAVIPPLALKGPCVTIRKFRKEMLGPEELIKYGSCVPGMMDFLKMCVTARKNLVISGGTGSGKTTTLNIVSNYIPETERIVTVEDAAELQMHHEHWIQLESRPPNIEGKGQVTIRDLVRNCLRMRPDRIIVGECRGGEALDMLQAMNTGHDGSLTTAHANTPRDVLARLETMVLMSGMDLPIRAIREQIAAAIDIIAHQSRYPDGTRKITNITEVTGMEGDVITMQDIFVFKQEGFDDENRVVGRYVPSGFIPKFYEELQRRGIKVDMAIFRE